ncbi:hypothetical protein CALVIDRAFT_596948 [Calocera viscosa TUFC12733]|uniref:Uncharacterized protein n=1 Tax=Calocera viscosa (strain TUFC12733) TaxID=1330018 RepID=A0A167P5D5_CALVF|nr:hypothetical protein CALVIDRAFT_596948 [Calocera viscosa TUFC12733]
MLFRYWAPVLLALAAVALAVPTARELVGANDLAMVTIAVTSTATVTTMAPLLITTSQDVVSPLDPLLQNVVSQTYGILGNTTMQVTNLGSAEAGLLKEEIAGLWIVIIKAYVAAFTAAAKLGGFLNAYGTTLDGYLANLVSQIDVATHGVDTAIAKDAPELLAQLKAIAFARTSIAIFGAVAA